MCPSEGAACRARDNLARQGFAALVTLRQCSPEEEELMESGAEQRGRALQRWREAMATDATEFSLCGKKADVALKEVSKKIGGINLVVADVATAGDHVMGAYEYWSKHWNLIRKPFLLLVPILDAGDMRTFFLRSRYNHGDFEPEFYSEMYVGDGERTMSFGMIHEGTSDSLQRLMRAQVKLDQNEAVKFTDIRKITIRGATREQRNYDPRTFLWAAYDQRPGLEQFYGQRPVGGQSVFQLGAAPGAEGALSLPVVREAFSAAVRGWSGGDGAARQAHHGIGEGSLSVAQAAGGQAAVIWDGADSVTINIFTYDEAQDHYAAFGAVLVDLLPAMNLLLRDEQPRG